MIVGAGPAGATAARTLAAAGASVTVLDRAEFPRHKPCGGGISLRVLRRFPYLECELPRIATHTVSRLYLEGPDASAVVDAGEPAALMIRRLEFDALLVSLATEAGATFAPRVDVAQAREDADGVTLTARDGREFRAPIVIAADGVHSVVARRLGLNPGWPASAVALDMMEETPRNQLRDLDPSTLWINYGERGYSYVFPKRNHVNIGIGYVLSYFRDSVDAAPYELQRRFVATLRDRGIVAGDSVKQNFTPFLLPVSGPLTPPARGRVLAVGDAGGFVNAFTAEGIFYAMVSGELAAQAILRSRHDLREASPHYCRAADDEMGTELRDSVLIQRYLFQDRRRIGRAIRGANHAGAITNLVRDLVVGRRTYAEVRLRILARSPALAARTAWEYLLSRTAKISRM
ncbi:MAG TPA: NAD(P)/FAD-dependent oxidoreductase [Vicinamibacterales bacterium]|nr:NAD(P)/FAD-dependent oxidoreductase [Vicinamibacterales bacterium]